jgi:hypothetical protein
MGEAGHLEAGIYKVVNMADSGYCPSMDVMVSV